jgi:signal transduction histidine kinase
MHRPWHTWLLFALALAVVFAALGWVSRTALRLDREQAEARSAADFEENVRLALWRMDSRLAAFVAQESARPYFAYQPFYPADRAVTKTNNLLAAGEVLVSSPLLADPPLNVNIHFQIDPAGNLTSPQAPQGGWRDLAIDNGLEPGQLARNGGTLSRFAPNVDQKRLLAELPLDRPQAANSPPANPANSDISAANNKTFIADQGNASKEQQALRGAREYNNRFNFAQDANDSSFGQQNPASSGKNKQSRNPQTAAPDQQANKPQSSSPIAQNEPAPQQAKQQVDQKKPEMVQVKPVTPPAVKQPEPLPAQPALPEIKEQRETDREKLLSGLSPLMSDAVVGALKPLWAGEELLLARRAVVAGKDYVQGCWIDWPKVRSSLLDDVRDLLPDADLAPLRGPVDPRDTRLLAAIPARLIPGAAPVLIDEGLSPIKVSLAVAWGFVLLAAAAAAAVLAGALALSERRAAFVSAVSHELRTPLTTFRMYAEMLGRGMVAGEDQRAEYIRTLHRESERLSRLVDNVLAYSRIERGRSPGRLQTVRAADLVDRVRDRLSERAAQAGMSFDASPPPAGLSLRADPEAVDQVLFNLVDNAAKYACRADDKRIHLEMAREGSWAVLRVRDHGSGVPFDELPRLFRAFHKSARDAAGKAPGVGLGLALCRRLARQMGGDLAVDKSVRDGACLVLRLRSAQDG